MQKLNYRLFTNRKLIFDAQDEERTIESVLSGDATRQDSRRVSGRKATGSKTKSLERQLSYN